jgi:tyrosine-protein phosphatase MSG5
VNGALPGLKEEDEAHRSQEVQERGYPDGPVQIYDCGLYLYLEPTAEEACRFDTVINVAKEVKNPFELTAIPSRSIVSVMRGEAGRSETPEPATAASEMSFKSAWEYQPIGEATPTASRPESILFRREPEYLHVAWDHNSEILQDLYPLCELIDERTRQNKKVLVHCQLGVSRSASLVIAYGLYKGYQPDFHSMYTQVKGRSQWVGPNMSLIYQLNEFRGKITRGEYRDHSRLPPAHWFQNSFSPAVRQPMQALSIQSEVADSTGAEDPAKTPQASKPLRSLKLDKELPPVPLFPKDEKQTTPPKAVTTISEDAITSISRQVSLLARQNSIKQAAQPRPLPFRKLAEYSNPQSIPPPRPRVTPVLSIIRPSSQIMDLAGDEPQTPSLFSPRATEFMASPFGVSRAPGDLAIDGPKSARSIHSIDPPGPPPASYKRTKAERESLPPVIDPRSPHQHAGTGEILRHIDDFL